MIIEVTRNGKRYYGHAGIYADCLAVRSFYGKKTAQLGGLTAKTLAPILLGEIVDAYVEFYQAG